MNFSKTSITGELPENPTIETVLATALGDWGVCMSGLCEIPENFGKGMVKVGQYLKVSPTPDSLSDLADTILAKKSNS